MSADFEVFGQKFHLKTGPDRFLRDDSLWRLKAIYQRYLSATSLPKIGVALDIGAGFGAFAIPFATIFPNWQIWCFEPNEVAFAALCTNIAAHNLDNIAAFNVAVGAAVDPLADGLTEALKAKNAVAVKSLAPRRPYFQHKQKPGFIEVNTPPEARAEFDPISLPQIPANALSALAPDFLKLTAPQNETNILAGLARANLSYLVGETWSYVPSELVFLADGGGPQIYLPLAGSPPLCLRRMVEFNGLTPGLDIIASSPHLPGKTPRHSHIAFTQGSGEAHIELFHHLLELARYSGAEIVQGTSKAQAPRAKILPRLLARLMRMFKPPAPAKTLIPRQRIYRRDYLDHYNLWDLEPLEGSTLQDFHARCLKYDSVVVDLDDFPRF